MNREQLREEVTRILFPLDCQTASDPQLRCIEEILAAADQYQAHGIEEHARPYPWPPRPGRRKRNAAA